jgi:hypothetical protein
LLALPWAHSAFLAQPIDTLRGKIARCRTTLEADAPLAPPVPTASPAGSPAAPGPAPAAMPFARAMTVRDTIPRGNQRGAARLVAEWGRHETLWDC